MDIKKIILVIAVIASILWGSDYLSSHPSYYVYFTSVDGTVSYIKGFKLLSPIVSFVLLVIQAIIPLIPFFLLAGANGIVFGLWKGFLLTLTGTLLGASINFWLARFLGYEWVARKTRGTYLEKIEQMGSKKGFEAILTARLTPVFPAPMINILAGVSKVRFSTFLSASALGKLPFVAVYTYLGYNIAYARDHINVISISVGLLILAYFIFSYIKRRRQVSIRIKP